MANQTQGAWVFEIPGDYEVILGSDCHNMKTRLPNLQEGRNVIACKLGAQYLQEIDALGERILP